MMKIQHLFLIVFGSFWGAILERFGAKNRPKLVQIGVKTALETIFFEKSEISRKPLKTNEKSTFLTPRRLEHRPKIAPRRLQEVICWLLNLHLDFVLIFAPFWLPKCLPLGTLFAPKIY